MLKKVSFESIILCVFAAMILSLFGVAIAITEAAPINTDLYRNTRTNIPSIPIPEQITNESGGEYLNNIETLGEQPLNNQSTTEIVLNENQDEDEKEETTETSIQDQNSGFIKDLLLSIQNTIDNLL